MSAPADKPVKKVVLAYSGGLDTSIILKWLQTEYGAEVVTFTADLGQGEELGPAREKALKARAEPIPFRLAEAMHLEPAQALLIEQVPGRLRAVAPRRSAAGRADRAARCGAAARHPALHLLPEAPAHSADGQPQRHPLPRVSNRVRRRLAGFGVCGAAP